LKNRNVKYKSIAIITCWYGPYPWYFPYFVHSCLFSPTVDFIIITDNEEFIPNKPKNIKIIYRTLEEIKEIALEKLGFVVNIDHPFKLCDFKPAYGFLFSHILNEYDFWGHGDIDIVYGNIREFMIEELLNVYDILSSRHDFITGSFCLYKNNQQMNMLFMQSRDYKKVFTNAEHFCFDECNFQFIPLQKGYSIFDLPNEIESMTYVVKKEEREGKLNPFFDFIIIEGVSRKVKWDKGKIIYKDKFEGMYYNLIRYKVACKNPVIFNPIPETFYFHPRGITITPQ